jgi:NAD(P)-dependent dehydrogenase (short-subunit alcohol dehydrogenase family)
MSTGFSGKLALVTGGTGGLGRAVSLAFLEQGANVIVTYRERKEFDLLTNAAGKDSSLLEGHDADVTDEAAVRELVGKVLSQHGPLHVLVNAVGGYAGGVPLWELESKVFDRMLALNLRSGFVLTRAVVAGLLEQIIGAIVNSD